MGPWRAFRLHTYHSRKAAKFYPQNCACWPLCVEDARRFCNSEHLRQAAALETWQIEICRARRRAGCRPEEVEFKQRRQRPRKRIVLFRCRWRVFPFTITSIASIQFCQKYFSLEESVRIATRAAWDWSNSAAAATSRPEPSASVPEDRGSECPSSSAAGSGLGH